MIFVGTHGGGVYRSDDGGKSWKQRTEGLTNRDVHALVASRQHPGVVYAGTLNGGLFRSEDGGKTWIWSSQEDAQVWGLSLGRTANRETFRSWHLSLWRSMIAFLTMCISCLRRSCGA